MKKEIPQAAIIAAIAVVVLAVIGFGIYVLNPPEPQREGSGGMATIQPTKGSSNAAKGPMAGSLE